jgi:hypothetical protein
MKISKYKIWRISIARIHKEKQKKIARLLLYFVPVEYVGQKY